MYISVTKKVGALDAWAHERVSLNFFSLSIPKLDKEGGFSFGWLQTWPDYVYLYNTIDSHFVFTSWEKKSCMVGERGGLKSGDDEEGSMGGKGWVSVPFAVSGTFCCMYLCVMCINILCILWRRNKNSYVLRIFHAVWCGSNLFRPCVPGTLRELDTLTTSRRLCMSYVWTQYIGIFIRANN